MTKDKEPIIELTPDKTGGFRCPRCNNLFKFNIVTIRYCHRCGQHIAPYMMKGKEVAIKEEVLKSLKVEDIEK